MPNLLHTKNSRTQIYKTLPSNDVGSDGDIILSQIKGRGVFLCSKINGKWHVSNKMEELRKIEKTSINDLKLNRLKIGTSIITKNEYNVGDNFTLDVDGSILIKNSDKKTTISNSNLSVDALKKILFDGILGHTYIYESADDVLKIVVGNDDMLTIDEGGNLTSFQGAIQVGTNAKLNAGRRLVLDADNDGHTYIQEFADNVMKLAAGGTVMLTLDEPNSLATFSNAILAPTGVNVYSGRNIVLDSNTGNHTYIQEQSDDLMNFQVGGQDLMAISEKATTSVAQSSSIYTACPVYLKDIGGTSDTPQSGYGSLYVNSDVLYFKTDGGAETNLLAGGGGTSRWTRNTGGYITNKTSTTFYYFQYRPNSDIWNNSDSSPATINLYDSSSCQFHAPANGTLTNITATGYVNDTGATDPFKFYVYIGAVANDGTNTSLTLIGTSDAPATISAAAKTFSINTDISSSNSFSAGDGLWVMWKKDSNTGSQDVYFSITISGEYD